MEIDTQAHIAFFLTGRQFGDYLSGVDGHDLSPALLARFRELSGIRYDFPIILIENPTDDLMVDSLSHTIDKALRNIASGNEGDKIKKTVLQIEKEIRKMAISGATGKFSKLWTEAANRCLATENKSFIASIDQFRATIKIDGEIVDCNETLPKRLICHLWEVAQERKAEAFLKNINRLILKLSDIIKSDFERSEQGRTAEHLKHSIGNAHEKLFDFNVMSNLLSKSLPKESVPESLKKRISDLLTTLNSQKFFPSNENIDDKKTKSNLYTFIFDSCAAAMEAFKERMPKVIELAKALAIAELEIEGQYNPSKHNILFEDFGANGLDPNELALFPDYLVCVNTKNFPANEYAKLLEILSSDLPIKILLQTDDILEESHTKEGNLISGMRSKQLASMAMGLNEVYVLQSSNSNLYQFHEKVFKGLSYRGTALFSIFSGASGKTSGLSPYLISAAAMESRAFPAFAYDPSAGLNWASRFYLQSNSQLELDWPVQKFEYEDEHHQRISEDVAFTFIDFLACDTRYARHFAQLAQSKWNGSLVPIDESLTREKKGLPDKVPYVIMVDKHNVLQKIIVDDSMIREARRCREMWHSLQELGGIHNSHAEILLAREKRAWEARMQKEAEQQASLISSAPTATASATTTQTTPEAAAEPERSRDDAYIDTPRCSTCNECITLNNKMFGYNNDKQAYIMDISAGTYAQLVEAAENCQVSIIHPGKPKNPNEPGIEELLRRAELFR